MRPEFEFTWKLDEFQLTGFGQGILIFGEAVLTPYEDVRFTVDRIIIGDRILTGNNDQSVSDRELFDLISRDIDRSDRAADDFAEAFKEWQQPDPDAKRQEAIDRNMTNEQEGKIE